MFRRRNELDVAAILGRDMTEPPFKPFTPPPAPPPGPPAPPPEAVEIVPGVRLSESAMRFRYARSSGPGGQNVNKVNTKAELWVPLDALYGLNHRAMARLRQMAGKRLTVAGEIHIASDTERTQEANRAAVLQRLKDLLSQAVREPKLRRKTKPSRASKRRRLESKKHRGEIKAKRRGGAGDW
jgi:ribosome-associated protein